MTPSGFLDLDKFPSYFITMLVLFILAMNIGENNMKLFLVIYLESCLECC